MRWPPPDSDRNRFLFRLGAVLAALAGAYFLVWALVSGAVFPWAVFALLLAATVVLGAGLLLMRSEREGTSAAGGEPTPGVGPAAGAGPASGAGSAAGGRVSG